jgi:hypothetical protein
MSKQANHVYGGTAGLRPEGFTGEEPVPLETFAEKIHTTTAALKRVQWECGQAGVDSGIVRLCGHWAVYPRVFYENYYSKQQDLPVRMVPTEWDGNDLLNQDGLFFLHDVALRLPFTPAQLRYQAQIKGREKTGIFKYEPFRAYLVEMPVFARWITRIWLADA